MLLFATLDFFDALYTVPVLDSVVACLGDEVSALDSFKDAEDVLCIDSQDDCVALCIALPSESDTSMRVTSLTVSPAIIQRPPVLPLLQLPDPLPRPRTVPPDNLPPVWCSC